MKLYIENVPEVLLDGLDAFCTLHGIARASDGMKITICESGYRDICARHTAHTFLRNTSQLAGRYWIFATAVLSCA